jgi:hypothetical protein
MNEKTTETILYRDLIKFCFQNPKDLANNNADAMQEDHKIVLACRGKILMFLFFLTCYLNIFI